MPLYMAIITYHEYGCYLDFINRNRYCNWFIYLGVHYIIIKGEKNNGNNQEEQQTGGNRKPRIMEHHQRPDAYFVKAFDNGVSISTSIGKKDGDTWFNFYLPVYLAKDCKIEVIEGLNTINVKNAFLSPFKRKDGSAGLQLVITEAETI